MTPEIISWLRSVAYPHLPHNVAIVEVGALNVNGSARQVLEDKASLWQGIDRQPGLDVDVVADAATFLRGATQWDVCVCCEALEHDRTFWLTVEAMHKCLRPGGILVITTPTIAFPYHAYPVDYYRYTKDTYTETFFKGFDLIALDTLGAYPHECLAGLGRKHGETIR